MVARIHLTVPINSKIRDTFNAPLPQYTEYNALCFPYISLHTISPAIADAELQFSSPVEINRRTAGTVAQLMQGPQPDISDLLHLCQLPL